MVYNSLDKYSKGWGGEIKMMEIDKGPEKAQTPTTWIRIKETPPGQAPKEIRDAWVGTVLPIKPEGEIRGKVLMGVLGGKVDPENVPGYLVDWNEAVKLLKERSPEAARWWKRNRVRSILRGRVPKELHFAKSVCEIVPSEK